MDQIVNFKPIENPKTLDETYENRFRAKAKAEIPILIQNSKPKGPIKKELKRIVGGC
jgi:hypothetical protein